MNIIIIKKIKRGEGVFHTFDIFLVIEYASGISSIARATANAQEMLAIMLVTPLKVAKIAPAPIIRKME